MDSQINNDVENLETLVTNDEQKQGLKRLHQAARTGASMKWWFNRFLFGFNLADSVERWLNAFDPKIDKPLKDQIPKIETKEVVAAWMKFSMRKSIFLFFLSSFITLLTAGFLWGQIKKQDELIKVQTEKNNLEQRFLYTQVLYDEICTDPEKVLGKNTCKPKYNHRQRTDAVKSFIKTDKNLSKSHLEDINVNGEDFSGAILLEANLTRANLAGINLTEANLRKVNLEGAYLEGANLANTSLVRANLTNAGLGKANFTKADLTRANLSKVSMPGVILIEARLTTANLPKAFLPDADLTRANLAGAILDGAILDTTNLTDAIFENASLIEVGLGRADLTRAAFSFANLTKARLSFANLVEANLTEANLTEANLTGANLTGTNLHKANLTGATINTEKLIDINLTEANLSGAFLSDASNLTRLNLKNARYNKKTQLPEKFDPVKAGMILIED